MVDTPIDPRVTRRGLLGGAACLFMAGPASALPSGLQKLGRATTSTGSLAFVNGRPIALTDPAGTLIGEISGLSSTSGATLVSRSQTYEVGVSGTGANLNLGPSLFREPGRYLTRLHRSLTDTTQPVVAQTLVLRQGMSPGMPWSPYVNDHLVVNGWHQEDLGIGPVSQWKARGCRAALAAQADPTLQPVRTADGRGVEFPARAPNHLVWPNDAMRHLLVRAHLTILRIDPTAGAETFVVVPHGYTGSANNRCGAVIYNPTLGKLQVQWNDYTGYNSLVAPTNVTPNKETWAFVLGFRVDGNYCLKINGGPIIRTGKYHNPVYNNGSTSTFGCTIHRQNVAFAIDAHLDLQGELTDAVVAKLEWWAAQRAGIALPSGHRYANAAAVVDADDFPVSEDKFDKGAWDLYIADSKNTAVTASNRGKPVPSTVEGAFSELVFNDDFRRDSVVDGHKSAPGIWYSQGGLAHNTVGVNAVLGHASDTIDCYPHDPATGTLSIRLQYAGGAWRTGAISTVNLANQGITFQGPMAREIRFRFKIPTGPVARGYFPAPLWSYGVNRSKLFTGMAWEFDDLELDGRDPTYVNAGSSHSHEGLIAGWMGRRTPDEDKDRVKQLGAPMNGLNGFPKINFYDGQWHVLKTIVDDEFTYIVVDGVELNRVRTPLELFRRIHLISNFAMVLSYGEPSRTALHDMEIDYVRVWKKTRDVATVVAPFSARPQILGTPAVGSTLTVDAKLPGVTTVRYEYYHDDGYPLATASGPTYVVQSTDAGKRIRAKVIAMSATDQPEAWTEFTAAVPGGSPSVIPSPISGSGSTTSGTTTGTGTTSTGGSTSKRPKR
ncbi:hypothetical protein [Prosthecomicrobium sp. N25]|uniref:hypothetical protein n=1 Tax=Prosthecomicrobium sp. N25 TaxID=3129254 RepID=UPI0030778D96